MCIHVVGLAVLFELLVLCWVVCCACCAVHAMAIYLVLAVFVLT